MSVLINLFESKYLTHEIAGTAAAIRVQEAGHDLGVTDWIVEPAGSDSIKLRVPGPAQAYLFVERVGDTSGQFTLGVGHPETDAVAIWHTQIVATDADQEGVVHLVNTSFGQDLFLRVDDGGGSDGGSDVVVGTESTAADHAGAMWRIEGHGVTDARSVHLMYSVPNAPEQDAFYIEVRPQGLTYDERGEPDETTPLGTYYCAVTFGDLAKKYPSGYFGIQTKSDGSKMALFSMWDPPNQHPRLNAHFTQTGPGVTTTTFGNEGTGTSARMAYDWRWGETMRFCLLAEDTDDGTIITAYLAGQGEGWFAMATCHVPYAEGTLFGGRFYSFVEDFKRDGLLPNFSGVRSPWQRRHADFLNPWFRTAKENSTNDNSMTPVTKAKFTAYPHPFLSISAESISNGWSLMSGVDTSYGTPNWKLGDTLDIGVTNALPPDLPDSDAA